MTARWAVNGPTPGHRFGPRGWTAEGLVAHAATVFAHGPARDAWRAVFRSRLDWSAADASTLTDSWQFAFRPPGESVARAIGCVERCPVQWIDLWPADDLGSGVAGEGLVPDPAQLQQVEAWLAALNLNTHCAVVAGFPEQTASGARVPLWLWLPALWLTDPDAGDDGAQVVLTVDRTRPAAEIAEGLALALARAEQPQTLSVVAEATHRATLDLAALIARLRNPDAPRKVVAAWPEPVQVAKSRQQWLAALAERRPGAWLVDLRTPFGNLAAASPELLVRVAGQNVASLALAGTLDDAGGAGPGLAAEHGEVAHHIERTLAALGCAVDGTSLWHADGPLRHRATRFAGPKPAGMNALTVALHLHPTPALLGAPRRKALAWLSDLEPQARGLYGGFAGRLRADGTGEGECAVLLRGLERTAHRDRSWAGAGLVAACDPAAERAEIERKHAAIRQAFGATAA